MVLLKSGPRPGLGVHGPLDDTGIVLQLPERSTNAAPMTGHFLSSVTLHFRYCQTPQPAAELAKSVLRTYKELAVIHALGNPRRASLPRSCRSEIISRWLGISGSVPFDDFLWKVTFSAPDQCGMRTPAGGAVASPDWWSIRGTASTIMRLRVGIRPPLKPSLLLLLEAEQMNIRTTESGVDSVASNHTQNL